VFFCGSFEADQGPFGERRGSSCPVPAISVGGTVRRGSPPRPPTVRAGTDSRVHGSLKEQGRAASETNRKDLISMSFPNGPVVWDAWVCRRRRRRRRLLTGRRRPKSVGGSSSRRFCHLLLLLCCWTGQQSHLLGGCTGGAAAGLLMCAVNDHRWWCPFLSDRPCCSNVPVRSTVTTTATTMTTTLTATATTTRALFVLLRKDDPSVFMEGTVRSRTAAGEQAYEEAVAATAGAAAATAALRLRRPHVRLLVNRCFMRVALDAGLGISGVGDTNEPPRNERTNDRSMPRPRRDGTGRSKGGAHDPPWDRTVPEVAMLGRTDTAYPTLTIAPAPTTWGSRRC
jgi:hypothetical protein